MRTLDATGKSIDEAIFNGLRELQISIDEVEIDIIQQETKGVFGIGAKPAIVRLIEREPEQIVIPEYVANKGMPRERRDDRDRRDRRDNRDRHDRAPREHDRAPRRETPVDGMTPDAPREAAQEAAESMPRERAQQDRVPHDRAPRERRDNRDRRDNRGGRDRRDYDRTPAIVRPQIDYTAEAAEGNKAAEFLAGMLAAMGIEATVLANVTEEGIRLRIDSASMGILIGHRGETLDAIQYLTSLCVNRNRRENGYTRVTIDTEGYRDKREETLTRLARKIASQVKATGRARTLEPMNPYERRILHATLQNHPYVTTYSEGEEPNRHVVIALKKREERNN